MPTPLARGLIISLSLLFAAGAAVYENPQVRQWVDESRRKVAIALHSLGDELAPQSPNRTSARDASTQEDESPEAVEKRRHARQEILERGRLMEERRKARHAKGEGMSFDELVDKDGALRRDEGTTAKVTAAEPKAAEAGLRHRATESKGAAFGSTFANPFFNGMRFEQQESQIVQSVDVEATSRSSTPTPPISPPVPPKPAAYQPQRILIDTDEASCHSSEHLVDLTPTTSASSAADDLAELDQGEREPPLSGYLCVTEWAQNQSVRSSPSSQQPMTTASSESGFETADGSVADSVAHASHAGTEDMDVMSEFDEAIGTPSTWTEVGSQVSED